MGGAAAPSGIFDPSAAGAATGSDPSAIGALWGLPQAGVTAKVNVTPGGAPSDVGSMLAAFYSLPPDRQADLRAQLEASGYYTAPAAGQTLDDATLNAYRRLILDAARSGKTPDTLLSESVASHAQTAGKQAASPRTLGLGKFPLALTNPDDVLTAADSMATQLVGRRATKEEVAKLTTDLQSKERAGKDAASQQYLAQTLPYLESQHGGIVGSAQAGTAPPPPGAAAPTLPTNPAAPLPAGQGMLGPTGDLAGQPAPIAPSTAGSVNAGPDNPANAPGAAPPAVPTAPLPAGAVTLADGTVIVPPTPIEYQAAPSASSEAYAMYANTPEMQAYAVAKAYAALDNFIKAK